MAAYPAEYDRLMHILEQNDGKWQGAREGLRHMLDATEGQLLELLNSLVTFGAVQVSFVHDQVNVRLLNSPFTAQWRAQQ